MQSPYQNLIHLESSPVLSEVEVMDTTLRDGAQTPGIAFTLQQKLYIAKTLDEVGIPMIEAGFPAVSDMEAESFRAIIDLGLNAKITGLSRMKKHDVDVIKNCGGRYIGLFLPGSDTHLEKKLHMSVTDALAKIREIVSYAVSIGLMVRFSVEDASRSPFPRLIMMYKAALDSGAYMVSFADTVGVMTPSSMKIVFRRLKEELQGACLSVHCHNDYGLGLANCLAAAEEGAYQLQVCLNGLGERTGNVPLEELVVLLYMQYRLDLGINFPKLNELCQKVYSFTDIAPPFNKPIVGQNCFTHESGIHVDGIRKEKSTYQPYPPELIGRKNRIVLGKH